MASRWLAVAATGLLSFGCSSSTPGGDGAAGVSGATGKKDASGGAGGGAIGDDAATDADAGADAATDAEAGADESGTGGDADLPPWRELGITVPPGEHVHTTSYGLTAGFDNRSAKMAGKLVLDIGVLKSVLIGGYRADVAKRGFHVIGVQDVAGCDNVDDWTLGRDFEGNCRLNNLDGLPHGDQNAVTPEQSIMSQVFQTLTSFEQTYPGEGWGYFLTQDGAGVRWSDVILTGISHCAQDAACFAHELRVSRVVAAAGPRDNTCGKGVAPGDFDPNDPPWWPVAATCDATHCCEAHIASWIDAPSATPIERYYGLVGKMDTQYGDILFTMERMSFVGAPINVSKVAAPSGGSHRLYAETGHGGLSLFPTDALNVAFGVSPENLNPTF